MKKSVTVLDDTCKRNAIVRVTSDLRERLRRQGRPVPNHIMWLPAKDQFGRQVQETVTIERVLDGAHLEHAVRRAKRWIRSKRFRIPGKGGMPHHIAIFMAAFHKADPKGFELAMKPFAPKEKAV